MYTVCIDVFTPQEQPWMQGYEHYRIAGPYGDYFTFVPSKNTQSIVRECKKRHIRYRTYEKRWSRSNDYRKNFFDTYPAVHGNYQCRYCRKKFSRRNIEVDHIVPVNQTKKSKHARRILVLRGISNVNDVRNLAPACKKCNRKKGDKMGIWLLRGWFGEYRLYWLLEKTCFVILICLLIRAISRPLFQL